MAENWPQAGDPDVAEDPQVTLDTSVAHPARVYDYWLGGKDNFAVDRIAAERVIAAYPDIVYIEQLTSALYLSGRAEVDHYLEVMNDLSGQALTPARSARFLADLTREA